MEIFDVLNELEELIEDSTKIPMTAKVIVDADELLDFVDRIRSVMPEEIKQAKWIAKEHQRIISDAEGEAIKIVEEAKDQITKIAEESQVVKQAEMQADEIIKKARQTASELMAGANGYADDVLSSLEHSLSKTLDEVKQGREELYKTANK